MELDFWLKKWESNDTGFHQREINVSLTTFWPTLKLGGQGRILVPLCGKSRDMLWLAEQGHEVVGVEISPVAVQDFFEENQLAVSKTSLGGLALWQAGALQLICGDFFVTAPSIIAGLSAVYDRAALVAMPPVLRSRYAAHINALMPDGALMLLVTMEYPDGQMQGPPFSVSDREIKALYAADFNVQMLAERHALDDDPNFRRRGLSRLIERVYLLSKVSNSTGW